MGVFFVSTSTYRKYAIIMVLKTSYFNYVEKQVTYLQHQFDRPQKECMLSTALDVHEGSIHFSILALEVPGFSQELLPLRS